MVYLIFGFFFEYVKKRSVRCYWYWSGGEGVGWDMRISNGFLKVFFRFSKNFNFNILLRWENNFNMLEIVI